MKVAKERAVHAAREAAGWIDRHAVKLTVVLIAAVILLPTFLVWNYTKQVGALAERVSDQQAQQEVNVRKIRQLSADNRALVSSLQSAIVEACETIGNERAVVAREQLHEEIKDAKNPDPVVLEAFDIPPQKLHELIAENVERLEQRLGRVKLTNCAAQYHISPGSGERRRDR